MKKVTLFDVVLCVLSLALCLGTAFVFHPCGPKDDGSWMLCHWAGRTVVALGAAFVLASIIRFFVPAEAKKGFSLAFLPFSVVTFLVPGFLIKMCMMHEMRCWSVMKPFVSVLTVLILIAALVDVILGVIKK